MQILTLRLSVFGDYKRYIPTAQNSIQWTQALQKAGYDFLPNMIQVQQPASQGTPATTEKRMQFVSPSGDICIRILAERVDVEFARGSSDHLDRYFADKFAMGTQIMSTMLSALGDTKGRRLAYYVDAFIPEQEGKSLQTFYQDNNLGISLRNSCDECVEWNHRFNRRACFDVNGEGEVSNIIFTSESGVMQALHVATHERLAYRGMRITADINTLAENEDERFGAAHAEGFYSQAHTLYLGVMQQLETKLP